MEYRVLSIGTLAQHELWPNDPGGRTPHATCTLVRSGDAIIVIDPGLPAEVIRARLSERAGLRPEQVTHVFVTGFRPAHRWGVDAFPKARWLTSELERERVGGFLVEQFRESGSDAEKESLKQEIDLLQRFQAAEDKLAPGVDLFPLPGYTPGTCGLLLTTPTQTVLLAGDAVLTGEHLLAGRVSSSSFDYEQAKESLQEAIEIADVVVPGHDNVTVNPVRRPF